MEQISHRSVTIQFQNSSRSVLLHFWNISKATFPVFVQELSQNYSVTVLEQKWD